MYDENDVNPSQEQPMQGQSVQPQPSYGTYIPPTQGQPMQGYPMQGQPVQSQPMQGYPMQGMYMQPNYGVYKGQYKKAKTGKWNALLVLMIIFASIGMAINVLFLIADFGWKYIPFIFRYDLIYHLTLRGAANTMYLVSIAAYIIMIATKKSRALLFFPVIAIILNLIVLIKNNGEAGNTSLYNISYILFIICCVVMILHMLVKAKAMFIINIVNMVVILAVTCFFVISMMNDGHRSFGEEYCLALLNLFGFELLNVFLKGGLMLREKKTGSVEGR